jgi:hypothetical protein
MKKTTPFRFRCLTAAAALAGCCAAPTTASADLIDFSYTGAEVTFTAPNTGVYDITAFGAKGGGR